MRGLIKNELEKVFTRNMVIALSIIIIAVSFLSFSACIANSKEGSVENRIKSINNKIEYFKGLNGLSEDSKKETIKKLQDEIKLIKQQELSNISSKDKLRSQIKDLEKSESDPTLEAQDRETINTNIKADKYYLSHNIAPQRYNQVNALSGIEAMIFYMTLLTVTVLVALISGNMISKENSSQTIKLLISKPVSRRKIFLSKFIASLISIEGLVVISELIAFVLIAVFYGVGNVNQQLGVWTKYHKAILSSGQIGIAPILGSTQIVSIWKAIVLDLLLQMLYIAAISSFCFMISTVVKSSAISSVISLAAVVISLLLQLFSGTQKIAHFFIGTYSSCIEVLTGNTALQTGNANITAVNGVIVMIVSSIIFIAISMLMFNKRDIKG